MPAAQVETRDPEQEARVAALLAAPIAEPAAHPDVAIIALADAASLEERTAQISCNAAEDPPKGEDGPAFFDRSYDLLKRVTATRPSTLAGIAAKARVMLTHADNADDLGSDHAVCQLAIGLARDAVRLDQAGGPFEVADDPIFEVIAENRRLFDAWTEATKLPLVGIDPAPETDAAQDTFYAHCDDVLLQTVPKTAAGCASLAHYAHQFATREGFTLDNQNKDATDHLRILDLIGRSPLLPSDPAEAEALALVDAIERTWAWWSAGQDADLDDFSPEAEERHTDRNAKRDALINAAIALPATTLTARHAKALALAWIELVDAQRPGQPRDKYGRDGKLWFDIDAALVAAAGSAQGNHCHDVVAASQDAAIEGPLPFELSGLSMLELLNFMEEFEAGAHHWIGVENAPWARMRAGRRTMAGEIADAEFSRQSRIRDAMAAEVERRANVEGEDRDIQLEALVRYELMCNGSLREAPDLLAAITRQWGAQA